MRLGKVSETVKVMVMETKKKMTYGLKKTKYMVVNTGKEPEEAINEGVHEGVVEKVDEYKYVGLWLNEDGNLMLHLKRSMEKLPGKIQQIKNISSKHNIGPDYMRVRLKLYETCVVPSLLFNLEGWGHISNDEMKKLEHQQAFSLTKLLEIPISTPYWGLLSEIGIWSMEFRIKYRRLMMYQNIILKSKDNRIAKRIIEDQIKTMEPHTLYETIKDTCSELRINIHNIPSIMKSELKSQAKDRIKGKMAQYIRRKCADMKKLRFLETDCLRRQRYVTDSDTCKTIMKIRLNMMEVAGQLQTKQQRYNLSSL